MDTRNAPPRFFVNAAAIAVAPPCALDGVEVRELTALNAAPRRLAGGRRLQITASLLLEPVEPPPLGPGIASKVLEPPPRRPCVGATAGCPPSCRSWPRLSGRATAVGGTGRRLDWGLPTSASTADRSDGGATAAVGIGHPREGGRPTSPGTGRRSDGGATGAVVSAHRRADGVARARCDRASARRWLSHVRRDAASSRLWDERVLSDSASTRRVLDHRRRDWPSNW